MKKFDEIKREPLLQEAAYLGSVDFWKKYYVELKAEEFLALERPDFVNVEGLSWDWCFESLELLVALYSGGEPVEALEFYADHMFSQFQRHKQAYPSFSLKLWEPDAYQYTLWLLSFAVLFNKPGRIRQIAGF